MTIMKKVFKYAFVLLAAAGVMASCAKQVEDIYTPGAADDPNCLVVSFPKQDATGSHTFDPTMPKTMTFTAKRSVTSGDITVPVELLDTAGVFKVDPITFADGQEETTFDVSFENAKVGTNYGMTLSITDPKYASVYGAGSTSINFDVLVVSWEYVTAPNSTEPALFEFTQNWWGETAWGYIKYYEVDGVRTCFTETIKHDYNGDVYDDPGFWGYGSEYEWKFIWYPEVAHPTIEGASLIMLPWQPTGYVRDDLGMIYLGDEICGRNALGSNYSWMNNATAGNFLVSYYDGNGGFYFGVWWYINASGSGWNVSSDYDTIGIGEGFVRTDYKVKAVESDYSYDGVSPIYIETGKDVSYVKYAIYPGELTSTQAANKAPLIADGTDESVKFDAFEFDESTNTKYVMLEVAPETTGHYTFVAVSFNEDDELQDSGYATFYHVAAADVEDNKVELSVFTEATPSRYKELHSYDSFAYGISGKDLTEVHVGTFNEATVSRYGADYLFNYVKSNSNPVSDATLAQINADGGYYDVLSGLTANTVFYVIVWATNGAMDDFAYASFETDKLPYVWNSLGKGTLTDGFFVGMFGRPDYTVPCDVYEEASTPGLYMITGFQCALTAQFFGATEEEMADYENGNWRNAQVVIDATNPDAVVIEDQDYGVLVNSNYGWIMIGTEASGTLKDGEITFPAKEMYAYLGAWYYANNDGTFKVTLPSASSSAPALTKLGAKGSVNDAELTNATPWEKPVVKYEREAQPVKVAAKASYTRKSNEKGITIPYRMAQ